MSEVTRILNRAQGGDSKAAEELLPVVYDELRRLAARRMAGEPPGHTLQTTALVHEAWLRLVGEGDRTFAGRTHFLATAAEAMRCILIDQARRRGSQKRGGDMTLEALDESRLELRAPSEEVLAVHEALDQLATEDPLAAQVVTMRYFAGLAIPDIAEALGIAPRTVDRHWSFARAWLKRAIRGEPAG